MKLEFPQDDADLARSLSAVIRVGDDLWVGSDEGTKAMCLRRDKGDRSKPPFRRVDERGGLPEVDLEGMDWDAQGGYLWMVGSHSLKRTAAKFATKKGSPIDDAENLARLSVISTGGNRFLLGRLPLKVDAKERSTVVQRGAYVPDHFGARVASTERTASYSMHCTMIRFSRSFSWRDMNRRGKKMAWTSRGSLGTLRRSG